MTAGKRNTSMVVALIMSMTVGAAVLRGLELQLVPGKPSFKGSTLLIADRSMRVQDVEVSFAASWEELPALGIDPDGPDSVCIVDADGGTHWVQRGPRVQMVVIGGDGASLGEAQRRSLLGTLGMLNQASGFDLVPVRLAGEAGRWSTGELSAPARELRTLLERKGIIK
jgi:hypothetical protein